MTASPNSCPYCGVELAQGATNDDHIFVASFGGRALVRAHERCNSTFGHQVEGMLSKPGEQLNRKVLRGSVDGDPDQRVEFDLKTGALRWHKNVTVTQEGNERTYTLRGTPDEVRRLANQILADHPDTPPGYVDELLAAAKPDDKPVNVRSTLRYDLGLAQQLAAKVAVGALARVAPEAVRSPLADNLRDLMWGRRTQPDLIDLDALNAFTEQLRGLGIAIEPLAPPREHDDRDPNRRPASRAIFAPLGDRTAIFVFLADLPLSFAGIVSNERLPIGGGLPVVVIDVKGGIQVRDVASEVAASATHPGPWATGPGWES